MALTFRKLHPVFAAEVGPVDLRNVFDEEPETISAGFYSRMGNAPLYSAYDYFGRQAFVQLAIKF